MKAIAYSYARFSTPEQLEGDSLRRQTDEAEKWAKRNGNVTLDTKTTFRDLGRSGYHGAHLKDPSLGGLATFLAMVESQPPKILPGSYLVVENADRMTRQTGWDAIGLFHRLVTAGVRIVILTPYEQVIERDMDTLKMMMLFMELARGHGESARKSELISKNWKRWKDTAGKTKEHLPGHIPFWLTKTEQGYKLNERADAVRLILDKWEDGWGVVRICRYLRQHDIKPIPVSKLSPSGYIAPGTLSLLLHRATLYGRCEALDDDNFYPPLITKDRWLALQGKLKKRRRSGSGPQSAVYLLTGLVKHRETGATYLPHLAEKCSNKVYIPSDYKAGGDTPITSFPVHVVEKAVIQCVKEIDWRDLFPQKDNEADKRLALQAEIDQLTEKLEGAAKAIDELGKPVASMVALMSKWEDRITQATGELLQLNIKAANPKADLFASAQTVLANLEGNEKRLKARNIIAQMIERIDVEFKCWGGKWRGAWLTVRFQDTQEYRHIYAIYHKPHRIGNGKTKDFSAILGTEKLQPDADAETSEDVFEFMRENILDIELERLEQKRERKKAYHAQWYAKKKTKKAP